MKMNRIHEMENYILQHKAVSLSDLTKVFGVSLNTVRRDLKTILKNPEFEKCYGGVQVATKTLSTIIPFSDRLCRSKAEKVVIGKLASCLVQDGMCIFLDSGTTTRQILPFLDDKKDLTILTHSFHVLSEAVKYSNLSVICLGGQYNASTQSFLSFSSMNMIGSFSIDLAFLATVGLSVGSGLSNTNYAETDFKRIITARAKKLALMADHSKFDQDALFSFCKFSELSYLITDQKPSNLYIEESLRQGIRLLYPAGDGC